MEQLPWIFAGIFLGYVVGQISERLFSKSRDRSSFQIPATSAPAELPTSRAAEQLERIQDEEFEDRLEALERLKDRRRKREAAEASEAASRKVATPVQVNGEARDMVPLDKISPKERARVLARRAGLMP